ncbi:MAG: hypothetical protein J6I31_07180 [Prevotella sp.]|nr:hypothetical protein [Prevotella sp.]
MKNVVYIFSLLLVLLCACTHGRYTAMRSGLDSMNERNRNDLPFAVSDVQPYADYFSQHGTPNDQMLAYYLLGRAYHEHGETPMALENYQKAIESSDTTAADCDYKQLSRVYSQIGQIYYYQGLTLQQLSAVDKAIHYALYVNDTLSAMSDYWQKCTIYEQQNRTDMALSILDTLALWYKTHDNLQLYAMAIGRKFSIMVDCNKYNEAVKYMNIYEQNSGLFNKQGDIDAGREIYYYFKGLLLLNQNKLDSAEFYFRKELQYGKDFNNQNAGSRGLSMLFQKRHMPDSTAKYATYSYAMNDSMYAHMATEEVARIQAMYDYTLHQEVARKKSEEAEMEKANRNIAVGVIILIILLFTYVTYYLVRKEKNSLAKYRSALRELKSMRSEKDSLKRHESEYMQLISVKERKIAELEKYVSKYGKQLYFKTANAERCLHESDTYKKIAGIAVRGQELTEADWMDISMLITEYFPGFDDFMATYKPQLKTNEYPICLLLRLHFKAVEISGMMNLSKSQVSQLCSDIMHKLFEKKGSSKDLSARLVKIF